MSGSIRRLGRGRFAAAMAAGVLLAWPVPGQATFDVPDNCRVGSGTYSGMLSGACDYATCVQNGVEVISIRFSGAYAKEYDYPRTPAIIFAKRQPSDSGEIRIDGNGRRDTLIVAQVGACGISGTWQLREDDAVLFSGSFSMQGTGFGETCIEDQGSGGGSGGSLCGLFGGGMTLLAAPALLALFARRTASRLRRR